VVGPVLIVDDDAVSRHVLVQALAAAELPHVALASGADALAQIDRIKPSIVLLDLVMPEPDGYQILRELRQRPETKDLPIVVLTGLDADDEIGRAFEAGADDFVRKPFRPVELVARIRGQLRLRGVVEELARKERDGQIVLELTQALASNLDFRGILFTVVQRIAEVARIERVSIVLVGEQGSTGYVVAASDDAQLRDLAIDLTHYPEIQQVLTSDEPLVISDAAAHPLMNLVRAREPARAFSSLAILPILYEGRPLGVLFLRARQVHAFGDRELSLCTTVSSAMAIALRNARVLQSLRDQTQQVTVARFEAERRMRSLQRYADFFESAADGIVVIDAAGRLLFSNPRARAITGYGEGELRGQATLRTLFEPMDFAQVLQLREEFARGNYPQSVDMRVRRKDGVFILLSVNFNSVLREEGAVLCSFRDVTAERAVDAELVKTKEFLQRVIDSSVDAIISADVDGKLLLFNRAAERLYGRTAQEMKGLDVNALYPEKGAERIMRLIREGGGRIEGLRATVINNDDEHVPVSLSAALLVEGETVVGSVAIFTDLRERMRMEQRLQAAQEQLIAQERQAVIAELAGAAAHELNQPLTSVMGYAQLLRKKLEPGSAGASAAEVIFSEAERMAGIVRKIGKITKYETKSYVGRARILDLDRASEEDTPSGKRALEGASVIADDAAPKSTRTPNPGGHANEG
jgi:PAS domain S-box-containing protein